MHVIWTNTKLTYAAVSAQGLRITATKNKANDKFIFSCKSIAIDHKANDTSIF